MKIGKYISELLFEKDFVILPGFGEFSTKYIPARFVPELKKVEKPSKVISFGDKRKTDDGVLSSYIAKQENIDHEKAKSFINAFVKEMNETLQAGKSVELENVGKFSPGVGGSITFEPDKSINYLKDSLGMGSAKEPEKKPAATTKPTAEKPEDKPAEKKPEDKPAEKETPKEPAAKAQPADTPKPEAKKPEPPKPEEKKEPVDTEKKPGITPKDEQKPKQAEPAKKEEILDEEEKPKLSPAVKWVAFVAIPLLVIIIIVAFNFNYIIGDKDPVTDTDKDRISFVDRIRGIFVDIDEPVEPTPVPEVEVEEEVIEPDPTEIEPDVTRPPHEPEPGRTVYHIVVGSFIEKHNAEIFAEDLQKQGATRASVFEQARTGHYRVSYGFYYSMREAESELERVKQNVNQNAWILKR